MKKLILLTMFMFICVYTYSQITTVEFDSYSIGKVKTELKFSEEKEVDALMTLDVERGYIYFRVEKEDVKYKVLGVRKKDNCFQAMLVEETSGFKYLLMECPGLPYVFLARDNIVYRYHIKQTVNNFNTSNK